MRPRMSSALRKLAVAIAITLLFASLGLFENVGYHVHSLTGALSLGDSSTQTDLDVHIEATFNPILHPFHWLIGQGYVKVDVSTLVEYGEGGSNQFGRTSHYGPDFNPFRQTPEPRALTLNNILEYWIFYVASWGFLENVGILLVVTIIIEISKQRLLYLELLAGAIGFLGGISGTIIGLAIGAVLLVICKIKPANRNIFAKFWNYLWERDNEAAVN